jgi:hypothetical protein
MDRFATDKLFAGSIPKLSFRWLRSAPGRHPEDIGPETNAFNYGATDVPAQVLVTGKDAEALARLGGSAMQRRGLSSVRYFAAGTVVAAPARAGAVTILPPTSCSSRWNSGDAMMIVPAAARRRSTASADREKDVGSSFK